MTRWRQRLGEEQLAALIQESLSVAHKTGALENKDLERVVVDTTVQPKAVAHPTDARLMHRALVKLVAFAKRERIASAAELRSGRQACRHHGRPIQPRAPVQAGSPAAQVLAHPARPHHSRHQSQGRDNPELEARFAPLRDLAVKVRHQDHRQRGPKVYSLHAPEVECIGKGKAGKPYEFGCKVSIVTPVTARN